MNYDVDDIINNEKPNKSPVVYNEDNDFQKVSMRAKTCTSEAWKFFSKIGMKGDKEKTKCNSCGQKYLK